MFVELEKIKQDAKRYQWLKKQALHLLAIVAWKFKSTHGIESTDINIVIDTAMEEEKKDIPEGFYEESGIISKEVFENLKNHKTPKSAKITRIETKISGEWKEGLVK